MALSFKQSNGIDLGYVLFILISMVLLLTAAYFFLKLYAKNSKIQKKGVIDLIETKRISVNTVVSLIKVQDQGFVYIESQKGVILQAIKLADDVQGVHNE
jgi:flagellar biogenesis protein FliO